MTGGPVDHSAKSKRESFPAITGPMIQRAMQRGWELVDERENGAEFRRRYRGRVSNLHVILTAARELDGKVWVHLSLSVIAVKPITRSEYVVLPNWGTITLARNAFFGPESKALMVVAPATEHVNLEEVHHLWHCPEGDGLPDFTRGSGTI